MSYNYEKLKKYANGEAWTHKGEGNPVGRLVKMIGIYKITNKLNGKAYIG
jgi:hypothetical protein